MHLRAGADGGKPGRADDGVMTRRTYPALWSDNGSKPLVGVVELGSSSLQLEGAAAEREARRCVPFEKIASLRMGRNGAERLAGLPVLVLELRDGIPDVRVAMTQPGALHELAETLMAALTERGADK